MTLGHFLAILLAIGAVVAVEQLPLQPPNANDYAVEAAVGTATLFERALIWP